MLMCSLLLVVGRKEESERITKCEIKEFIV